MSLEAKIELLTAAVVELTRVIQMPQAVSVGIENKPSLAIAPIATAEVVKEEVPNDPAEELKKSSPITDTSLPSSIESPAVTYDDVKAVTTAVSKIDKAKAVAGLARFGAKNAKELQEKQWADYVVYMKRVAASEIDPESSHE
jgi:hypothetical protein